MSVRDLFESLVRALDRGILLNINSGHVEINPWLGTDIHAISEVVFRRLVVEGIPWPSGSAPMRST